jgi:hypothetical protein
MTDQPTNQPASPIDQGDQLAHQPPKQLTSQSCSNHPTTLIGSLICKTIRSLDVATFIKRSMHRHLPTRAKQTQHCLLSHLLSNACLRPVARTWGLGRLKTVSFLCPARARPRSCYFFSASCGGILGARPPFEFPLHEEIRAHVLD